MEKKFYEIPSVEVLDLNVEGFFCASYGDSNADGIETETPEWD